MPPDAPLRPCRTLPVPPTRTHRRRSDRLPVSAFDAQPSRTRSPYSCPSMPVQATCLLVYRRPVYKLHLEVSVRPSLFPDLVSRHCPSLFPHFFVVLCLTL